MRIESRDKIIALKEERRRHISVLQSSFYGDITHIGKISPGCSTCFYRSPTSTFAVYTGCECNVECGYCYYDKNRNDVNWNIPDKIANNLADYYAMALSPNVDVLEISYNSWGETLQYMHVLEEASKITKKLEYSRGHRIYNHLYTNGILATHDVLERLKQFGVIELRFHVSASNFSNKVFEHMKDAKRMGFVVTVEEPSLPENKEKILQHLPLFQEIGVKHLDLVECQVTPYNYDYLDKQYSNGVIFRDYLWHFYDSGMVYDVIEEVIDKGYEFSVIDCNSRVEACRETKQILDRPVPLDPNLMEGVKADFNTNL